MDSGSESEELDSEEEEEYEEEEEESDGEEEENENDESNEETKLTDLNRLVELCAHFKIVKGRIENRFEINKREKGRKKVEEGEIQEFDASMSKFVFNLKR